MWIEDLVKNNQPAFLMLLGTLAGVVITQAGHLFAKFLDYRSRLKIKRLDMVVEVEKTYLIEPVVSFIDRDLALMQRLYARIFESEKDKTSLHLDSTYVFELSAVQARVKGLGDKHLNEKFKEFSQARIGIATDIEGKAHTQLKQAISLAGELLVILFNTLKKKEN